MADPDFIFDKRITPARPDLAAKYLEGKVTAERFVEGETLEVIDPVTPLRRAPAHDAPLETEALKGERVKVYDRNGEGWAWGQLASDGYVGWLPEFSLVAPRTKPTHKITALRTFAFPGPSIKLPPAESLTMGAAIEIIRHHGDFAVTPQQHFLPSQHIAELDASESDFVAVAERFAGTPYLWGGKSSLGIDCSGLIQVSLAATGIRAPRDSDMQQALLGALVAQDQWVLRRGDLIFWHGHVAIARDSETLIHANAHHMATAIEPIPQAIARIEAAGNTVLAVKRLI